MKRSFVISALGVVSTPELIALLANMAGKTTDIFICPGAGLMKKVMEEKFLLGSLNTEVSYLSKANPAAFEQFLNSINEAEDPTTIYVVDPTVFNQFPEFLVTKGFERPERLSYGMHGHMLCINAERKSYSILSVLLPTKTTADTKVKQSSEVFA